MTFYFYNAYLYEYNSEMNKTNKNLEKDINKYDIKTFIICNVIL